MDSRPIGIIDSGSGGLSIIKEIQALLPGESIISIGDHKNLPYGTKSQSFIRDRVVSLIHKLLEYRCKMIVIACNTATVAGIDWYREQFPNVPIVGVVPVIKTAASFTKTHAFCVLSTNYTAKSAYQKRLIHDFAPHDTVTVIGASNLVPLIEASGDQRTALDTELKALFSKQGQASCDVLVLGCTHYPFIKKEIQNVVGKSVRILDSGAAVARQVMRICTKNGILSEQTSGKTRYMTTGDTQNVASVYSRLLGRPTVVERVVIP